MANIYRVTAEKVWKVQWLVEADTPEEACDKAKEGIVVRRVMHSFDRMLDPDGQWDTVLHVGNEPNGGGDAI